jgi:flagellar basal body-associated protein FliL
MLTPAQQKVRQELEELQAIGRSLQNNDQVSSTIKRPRKKWILVGLLLFIFAISILAISYHNNAKHEDIESYLTRAKSYDEQSKQLLRRCIDGAVTEQFMLQAKSKQKELVRESKQLAAPPNFKDHHQDFIQLMEQRLTILQTLPKKNLIPLDVQQELMKDSLVKAFKRENITYILEEDGTIQYWIKSKFYQY